MNPLIVLYYHRILPFKGYDIDISTFKWQLSYVSNRFDIVGVEELKSVLGGKRLERPSVLLTFDDGFADNFVYAYPILKKYNAKAVIFPATSKIRDSEDVKDTLEDYWNGKVELKNLFIPDKRETALYDSLRGDYHEFLSWKELDIMKKSGIFEIGSHGHLHSKIFSDDNVHDFYHKDANVHWSFLYANNNNLNIGSPVFNMKSSLASKKFMPGDDFKRHTKDVFNEIYNKTQNYNKTKTKVLTEIKKYKNRGVFESDNDFKNRIFDELALSKRLIKEHLNTDTDLLSWPWGEYSKESIEVAKKAGFRYCFSTKKDFVGSKTDRCKIGRIHASDNIKRFKKRIFIYSHFTLSKIYNRFHI